MQDCRHVSKTLQEEVDTLIDRAGGWQPTRLEKLALLWSSGGTNNGVFTLLQPGALTAEPAHCSRRVPGFDCCQAV